MTLIKQNVIIDIYTNTEETPVSVLCDMQPYSGSLAQEEYGLDVDCVKRIYTPFNPLIKDGALVAKSGEAPLYIVKYAEHWDEEYTMALLSLIPTPSQDEHADFKSGTNSASDQYGGGFY